MAEISSYLTKQDRESFNSKFDNGRITIAEVMDTRNYSRTGEIKVWIPTSRIPKEDKSRWVLARYASPFYGVTASQRTYQQSYDKQQKSYGFFFVPPDIGNKVFIFYPNIQGSNVLAYWFACPVDPALSSMIPGIAYDENKQPHIEKTIGTKPNTAEAEEMDNSSIPFSPLWNAIQNQGLQDDLLRGPCSSSMKRESPSRAYGILSPLGHQFIMDDGWSESDSLKNWDNDSDGETSNSPTNDLEVDRYDSGIRLRTRDGVQILLSNTKGHVYMINKDGTAWVELHNDGYIDCWALKGVSAATEGDINFHAKRNINIDAGGDINFKAGKNFRIETGEQFTAKCTNEILFDAGKNIEMNTAENIIEHASQEINYYTPKYVVDAEDITQNGAIKVKTSIDVPTINATTINAGNVNAMLNGDVNGMATFASSAGVAALGSPTPFTNPQTAPTLKNPDNSQDVVTIEPEPVKSTHTGLDNIVKTINTRQPSPEPYYYHFYNDKDEDDQIPIVQETKEQIAAMPAKTSADNNTVSNTVDSTVKQTVIKKPESTETILPPDLRPDEEIVSLNKKDLFTVFEQSFQEVMLSEGGYVNDPKDPGGETKFGVSKRAYPNLDIYNLTLDDAKTIYRDDYWDKCNCDDLPNGVSVMVADFAYNSGTSRAVKCLQKCLGLPQTGSVNQTLIEKSKSVPINTLLLNYKKTRLNFLQSLSTWNRYGKGWTNRVNANYNFGKSFT